MEFFLIILIMLAAIGLSNVVNHIVPFIPVPLIQIALGVLIAVVREDSISRWNGAVFCAVYCPYPF